MSDLPLVVRGAVEADRTFIDSSFLASCMSSPPLAQYLSREVYYEVWPKLFEDVLRHAGTRLMVACAEDDPDQIYGWIMAGPVKDARKDLPPRAVIHFEYVKHVYRDFPVKEELRRAAGVPGDAHVVGSFRLIPRDR